MKFKFDISGLEAQIKKIEKNVSDNKEEILKEIAPEVELMMTHYMQTAVYDAYTPKRYKRTYDLLNSITSEVEDNTLYVYSEGKDLISDRGKYAPKPYSFYVQHGYEMPWSGEYMEGRDWVEPTVKELKEHLSQDKWIVKKIGLTLEKAIKERKR